MGGFDDIFESIDDITAAPEEEREELTVSEAEAVTGVWNAQDSGSVWSAGSVPKRPVAPAPKRAWSSAKEQQKPVKGLDPGSSDDWEEEDEILEDFTDGDDFGGGSGSFDDLF
jgi:hypothetical protein